MKTLIINGHPDLNSFTSKIARKKYENYKTNNNDVTLLEIAKLNFNPVFLGFGDDTTKEIEADLVEAQKQIKDANHIVIVSPIWWTTYPALLKGFFDRTLLPDFAFKYVKGKALPEKLLKGKTGELILLSDAPAWYRKYILRDPAATALKRDILGFCGIKVNKITRIGSMHNLTQEKRNKILNTI